MNRITRQKVPAAVAQQIEDYIHEAQLPRGSRLPSERELIKTLGVGRSSLREGIRILEVNGIVEIQNGRGTFVASTPADHCTVRMQFLSDKRTALESLRVRRQLETLAVEEAIENATEDDLEAIRKALDELERARAEGRSNTREDAAFHRLVYRVSGNEVLAQMLSAVKELSLFWERPLGDAHLFDDSDELHRPIYEAILKRDKAAGRRSVRQLLDRIEADIRKKQP